MMIVDRIEGEYAVIENENQHIDISLNELPQDIKDGDVLLYQDGIYTIDRQQTNQRREHIRALQNSLWDRKDK